MDADWSHDPAALPALVAPVTGDRADLVIGSRYTAGGGVTDWGIARRVISRGGSVFARLVLGLGPHDLTGGFKAWRAATLSAVPFDGVRAGGYVFQIEMTYRASRFGARVVEVPITFRDRRLGPVQDEPPDHRRGAVRRDRPALGRAARPRAGPGDVRVRRVSGWRPGSEPPAEPRAPGVRVVVDVRAIQDPERAPLTAIYLESLLDALDADPSDDESFAFLVGVDREDPTTRWPRLDGRSAGASSRPRGCSAPAP